MTTPEQNPDTELEVQELTEGNLEEVSGGVLLVGFGLTENHPFSEAFTQNGGNGGNGGAGRASSNDGLL